MGTGVNKIVIIYSDKDEGITKGKNFAVGYAKPILWSGKVLSRYTHVYAPDYPKIEQAYLDAGKSVYRKDGEENGEPQSEEKRVSEGQEKEQEQVIADETTEQEGSQNVPVGTASEESGETTHEPVWRELGWNKMRGLASEFSEEPIKSKDQAIAVLEQAESEGKI